MNGHLPKTVVLTGLCCCLCLFFILGITDNTVLSAVLCIVTFVTLFAVSLCTSGKASAIFLSVCTVICCIHGLLTYNLSEKKAEAFIENAADNAAYVYTAEVLSCNSYSSYSNADVKITHINQKPVKSSSKCRIGFYSGESLAAGDTLTFMGTAEKPSNNQDDTFDNVSYLRSRKIFITFPTVKILSVKVCTSPSWTQTTRSYMERAIYKYVPKDFNFSGADISHAMILGDKAMLSSELKDDFTKSGIIHLLCVSGMHISIIMGSIYVLLNILNVRKGVNYAILISFCLLYLTLIGFPVSAVRASLICIIGYCAALTGRSSDGYSSLFTSLIIICMLSPYSVLDISAQLSFFSSLGIITLTELFCKNGKGETKTSKKLLISLKSMLLANTGAVLFTYLISSKSFGGVSVVSIISTMLTSYACSILLISLLILIVLSPLTFLSPVLHFIGSICNSCALYMEGVAKFFANMKFSYTETGDVTVCFAIFLALTVLLCFFIYRDLRLCRICTVFAVALLSITVVFSSLISSIYKDSLYSVSYFRQNENDRQLSVKLGVQGYLIINADNTLCVNPKKAVFDTKTGYNYLLIIPDKLIHPSVLASNIKNFDKLYGVKQVFLPLTEEGKSLALSLAEKGCKTSFLQEHLDFGTMMLDFEFSENSTYFTVDDGKVKTAVLFSDDYSYGVFDSDCDIAAFFTRKTKNQFDTQSDLLPRCNTFVTRLKKDESYNRTQNTYGLKSFYVKE